VNDRRLPANWHTLSLGALWDRLNDPSRHPTPQVTVEAVMHAIRERGLAAMDEPATKQRLAHCDAAATKQIRERIERLREQGLLP
jgi:hypothetical protein